jgi:hypothetical protein
MRQVLMRVNMFSYTAPRSGAVRYELALKDTRMELIIQQKFGTTSVASTQKKRSTLDLTCQN